MQRERCNVRAVPEGTGQPGREVLYGRQPVHEALRAARRRFHTVWIDAHVRPTPDLDDIRAQCGRLRIPISTPDVHAFDRLVGDVNHQGIAAEVGHYPYTDLQTVVRDIEKRPAEALVLVLDHISDPQNLGAILRTAEVAGVTAVIIPSDRAAAVTPAAVRASAGAAEHMQVAIVTNLTRTLGTLKDAGLWIAGLEGDPEAKVYTETDLGGPLGVVVGSEGTGLHRLVKETCDFLVRIPMGGRVSSLNAAVACGVALFEVKRQRRSKAGGQASSKSE